MTLKFPALEAVRQNAAQTIHTAPQKAVKKSIAGLPVHRLNPGRCTIPVLHPQQDGLPFSMTLELYSSCNAPCSSAMADKPDQDFFSLQYILDGTGQVLRPKGGTEAIRSGDSILAPHRHTFLQAEPSLQEDPVPAESRQDDWQMALLTFLLPKDATRTGNFDGVIIPVEEGEAPRDFLSAEAAARIVAGAGRSAQSTALSSVEDAGMDMASASGGEQAVSIDQRQQAWQNGPETAGQSTNGKAVLQDSDTLHLRGDDSGAASPLQDTSEDSSTKSLEERRQQGVMEGIRRLFQRLLASRKQGLAADGPSILKRSLSELSAFRLPHQTNRLALVFDPLGDQVNFTFGVEIFEPGHRTTPHVHQLAHEIFVILAGTGDGFCDGKRFPLQSGDVVVFPPGSEHGIDVSEGSKMYCLEVMQPNDMFAELVRAGMPAGLLQNDDLCILVAAGCSNL